MKNFLPALRLLLFMTLLTGVIYPLVVTGVAQALFSSQANGEIVAHSGSPVGSRLIAQKFESARYFWPRPSAVDYNPLPSGGSNWGQASADLKKAYDERKQKLQASHLDNLLPPQDMLFASGSGLDPEISPEASNYQVKRVAQARSLPEEQVRQLVAQMTQGRQFGILGEPRVNVLALNLALDELGK